MTSVVLVSIPITQKEFVDRWEKENGPYGIERFRVADRIGSLEN